MSNVAAEKLNSGYFDVVCKGKYDAFAAQRGRRKISVNEIFISSQIDSYGAVEGFRSFFTEKLSCGLATVSRATSKLVEEGRISMKRLPNGKTEYRSVRLEEQEDGERKAPYYRMYNFFLSHVFEFTFQEKKDKQGNVVKPARTFSRKLTPSEALLLAFFFTYSSNKNRRKACFWGSYKTIADMLALSAREVERAISNLIAARLIFRHVRGQNRVRKSKYTANMKAIRPLCEKYAPKKVEKKPSSAYAAQIAAADARAAQDKHYDGLKREAEKQAEDYKRAFLYNAPQYAEIEKELRALAVPLAKAELYNLPSLGELQAKERTLQAQSAELCRRFNVDARFFEPKAWALCKKCSDTGTLPNGRPCGCYKEGAGELNKN